MARRTTPAASAIGKRRNSARKAPSDNYKERRQAVLTAAATAFREKGFDGVRMDDVARQLEMDRATLYYYYKNKHQLYHEVVLEAVHENLATAQRIAASPGSAREKVRELLVTLIDSYERTYPLAYVYVQEDMSRISDGDSPESAQLVELTTAYDDAIKLIINQGVDEGDFRSDVSASVIVYALIGAANWTHRWFRPGGALTGIELGEQFANIFLDGLLIGPARSRPARRAKQ